MGCSREGRYIFFILCFLQILFTVQRQIFDFLGYMWAPILCNFIHIISTIFGIFGVVHSKRNYVYFYIIWNIVFVAWNIFIICYYLEVGFLDQQTDVLALGTGSYTWWLANGPGCEPEFPTNLTFIDIYKPLKPVKVNNCWITHDHVEVIQAGVQCFLSALSFILFALVLQNIHKKDKPSGYKSGATSIYSIEFSNRGGSNSPDLDIESTDLNNDNNPANKPMTPRKVKRRSLTRSSIRSYNRNSRPRSSGRSRQSYVNPVMRLMEQGVESSTSNDSYQMPSFNPRGSTRSKGHLNPAYQSSRPNSMHSIPRDLPRPKSAQSSYSNYHGQRPYPINSYISSTLVSNNISMDVSQDSSYNMGTNSETVI